MAQAPGGYLSAGGQVLIPGGANFVMGGVPVSHQMTPQSAMQVYSQ